MMIDVNYLAVLAAGVVSMALGFLWYSPVILGKPWMKAMGFTASELKKAQQTMGPWYGVSFVLSLVMAFVLSHVMILSMNFFHYDKMTTGLTTAFWMWVGFVMPVQFTTAMFSRKFDSNQMTLFGVNTAYQLVSLILMSIVIGLFM